MLHRLHPPRPRTSHYSFAVAIDRVHSLAAFGLSLFAIHQSDCRHPHLETSGLSAIRFCLTTQKQTGLVKKHVRLVKLQLLGLDSLSRKLEVSHFQLVPSVIPNDQTL